MPGLASGIDTKDLIRKLVEVEKAPIARLETNKRDLSDTSKALTELRKRTKTLQDALHAMASFEAAFEQKKLNATPAGVIEGTVKKNAPPSRHTLNVLKLASNLSIASAPISPTKRLEPARIKIAGVESNFNGGTIQSLREHLQKYHSKHVTAKTVQVRENESILIIDTIAQGEDALLKIEDADGLLKGIGLISMQSTPDFGKQTPPDSKKDGAKKDEPPAPSETEEKERWLVEPLKLEALGGAKINPAEDKKSLTIPENASARYKFTGAESNPTKRLTKISIAATAGGADGEIDDAPDSLSDGIKDNINIKGIELETYNITRTRKKEAMKDVDYGVVLKYGATEQKISLKGKTGVQSLPVEKDLASVEFYAQGSDILFEPAELTYAVKNEPKPDHKNEAPDKTPGENEQRKVFPNLLRAAQNAKLKIDGIDISRKSNSNLSDIIDGVSVNLLKTSPDNVETEILNDNESAKKQVISFVKAYNELLQFSDEVAKSAKVKEAGKFQEMRKESGILATNATIRQLITGLKIHTSNAYPTAREPHLRTLAAIGITTGAVGAKREDVVKGYLEVDEQKLTQMLVENPTAVKELFSIDTNGDLRIDNGYAHVTENYLEPYTRFTRGLIAEQIKSNAERSKQIDKDIKRMEVHVKAFEDKQRAKFGAMEQKVGKSKSTGTFLKQKLGDGH